MTAGLFSSAGLDAQRDPTAIDIQKVANNLYVVTGGRGTGSSANTISGCTTVCSRTIRGTATFQPVRSGGEVG